MWAQSPFLKRLNKKQATVFQQANYGEWLWPFPILQIYDRTFSFHRHRALWIQGKCNQVHRESFFCIKTCLCPRAHPGGSHSVEAWTSVCCLPFTGASPFWELGWSIDTSPFWEPHVPMESEKDKNKPSSPRKQSFWWPNSESSWCKANNVYENR